MTGISVDQNLRAGLVVLCLLVSGCAQRIPPVQVGEPGIPSASLPPIYFDTFDGVAGAAGLRPLRLLRGQPGREVRIWIGGGLGYPQELYRFVQQRDRVSGELVLYWHASPPDTSFDERLGETFHDLMLYSQAGRCTGFLVGHGFGICRALFVKPPDWGSVLRRAEAAGLWELPDESLLPDRRMVLDGWAITVELRDGHSYRAYHYGNPDHQVWAQARQAVDVARTMSSIDSLVRQPDVLRTYRGVTTGKYLAEFRDCDSGAAWWLYNDLLADASRAALEIPAVSDTTTLLYVEVQGELTPEWLAREWKSPYPRVLQVNAIRHIAVWTGVECRRSAAPPPN